MTAGCGGRGPRTRGGRSPRGGGQEAGGGRSHGVERASRKPVRLDLETSAHEVRVALTSELGGERFVRVLTFNAAPAFIGGRVEGVARPRYTVTCRVMTALAPAELEMDTIGGVIKRPRERQYSPTFW